MMCTRIRPSSPPRSPALVMVCVIGMRMAWYGMNIPKRISGNTASAPGKRHLLSTNPFIAPSFEEISAAGMASIMLLRKPSCSFGQTAAKLANDSDAGSSHILETLTSAGCLNAVMTSAYTGMRKNSISPNSARYRNVVRYGAQRDLIAVRPAVTGPATTGGAVVVGALIGAAPTAPCTRYTG